MKNVFLAGGVVSTFTLCVSHAYADYIYMRQIPDCAVRAGETVDITHTCRGTMHDSSREFAIAAVLEPVSEQVHGEQKAIFSKIFVKTYGSDGGYAHFFKMILKTRFLCTGPGATEYCFSVWRPEGESAILVSNNGSILPNPDDNQPIAAETYKCLNGMIRITHVMFDHKGPDKEVSDGLNIRQDRDRDLAHEGNGEGAGEWIAQGETGGPGNELII